MEEEFKKLQEIHLDRTTTAMEVFRGYECDHCRIGIEEVDVLHICEVLPGSTVCGDCYREHSIPDPGERYQCDLYRETCRDLKVREGWYHQPVSGLACCLAHSTKEMIELNFQFIGNPRDYVREVRRDQRFYRDDNGAMALYDEPVDDVENLRLPEVLSKDVSRIKDLCCRLTMPWWSCLGSIDGKNTSPERLLAFKKYGALRAWMPFDRVDVDFSFPISYCFLVYCDSSKEMFGQVLMLKCFGDSNSGAYGIKLNIHQYLEKKYELLRFLESFLDLPTPLVQIIWDYAYEGMKLVEFVSQSK